MLAHSNMKTYFLIFDGNPKPHLAPLESLEPDLAVVSIGSSVHCISFSSSLFETVIMNALSPHVARGRDLYLLPASLPIYPPCPKKPEASTPYQMKDIPLFYTDPTTKGITFHSLVGATQVTKTQVTFLSQEYLQVKLGTNYYCKRFARTGSQELWKLDLPQTLDHISPHTYTATFECKDIDIDDDWMAEKRG